MKTCASLAASVALLFSATTQAAGSLYTRNSPVVQVSAKTYDDLIAKSNHTSIVEFYAPWCGHCQKLQPAYEKAAQRLKGLAKVAAVNCEKDENKSFCGEMGVKGFPTLKIVRPGKKSGRPTTEEYMGQRTAKALVDAVVEKIPNHVKRVTDKSMNSWLKQSNETAKAILFTEKGTTSALLRALAIDFLGSINFGQVRNKETTTIESFGITEYPTFVLLPGGDKDSLVYSGDMKKEAMSEFLSQIAPPNPDPAPKKVKAKTAKPAKAAPGKKEKKIKVPKPVEDESSSEAEQAQKADQAQTDDPKDQINDEEAAGPIVPVINDETTLQKLCLQDTSKLCALVLLPNFDPKTQEVPEGMIEGLKSIAEVYEKHNKRRSAFPFYLVEPSLPLVATLRKQLALKPSEQMDLVVLNAKRRRYQKYTASDFSLNNVEAWVDAIRMNEGKKGELPEALIVKDIKEEVPTKEEAPVREEAPVKEEIPAKEEVPTKETKETTGKSKDEPSPDAERKEFATEKDEL